MSKPIEKIISPMLSDQEAMDQINAVGIYDDKALALLHLIDNPFVLKWTSKRLRDDLDVVT